MASRDLKDLHPVVLAKARLFIDKCAQENIGVLIYCTYRSNEEQAELYKQGRTRPGKIVTYAKAGQSKHNYMVNGKPASLAFDCVPMRSGKPVWSDKSPQDLQLWLEIARIGKSVGLQWAGDWIKRKREKPHFESEIK